MNKLIIALVAILLSSSAFAGCGDWNGRTYTRCVEVRDYDHHRGQSIGREIAEAGIGGAIAIAAVHVGEAVGNRIARAIDPPPPAGGQVVYIVQQRGGGCTYVPVWTDRGWDQQIRCQ